MIHRNGCIQNYPVKTYYLLGYDAFSWQRSVRDYIIRDEKSFMTI